MTTKTAIPTVHRFPGSLLLIFLISLLPVCRTAYGAEPDFVPTSLAATPPMGWNSWNHFGKAISASDVQRVSDALVSSGMRNAGYVYVNIDDGWQGQRDAAGQLHGNDRFPDIKGLAQYVHARGLKLGIYSTPGVKSCAGFEGSAGHEDQDARTFAEWGVDFLKYDVCSFREELAEKAQGDPVVAQEMMRAAYLKMHLALEKAGRPILLSISQHGMSSVWAWAPSIGIHMWRTGDDVRDRYESITEIGFAQAGLARFSGPGHWNDPDMLEIGNKGLDLDEARTQMSLWSLLAAPLLAGNDPSATTPEMLAVLTNCGSIAIDQDPAGKQADRLLAQGPVEIWSRDLEDGSKAVGIFNRNAGASWMTLDLSLLGWASTGPVKDIWRDTTLPPLSPSQKFLIPRHGVVLLRVSPSAR
ncbi:glycoside hydrolase family 27 protein [Granulicella sp. WH15]|uniref:glycoside hydrolase family 27 protein n=1 Tax=Granulicella sp. WH15 TaxID=2602070 RepID=UPI001367106C|nr:glycoside hydrolase family 27 protein [Granulicella sp. WH15]QHN03625.1 glycoside hydrolase family 27 protein [Granulicella sp. WH15]